MNIIICGLKGSGKTTLSKKIATRFNYKYINDYQIGLKESEIIKFIKNNNNYVLDLCYSLTPKECSKLENIIVYYLGFISLDNNTLYNLMKEKRLNVTLNKIEKMKNDSLLFKQECDKYGISFIDISDKRNEIIKEIIYNIEEKLKEIK
jgi:adenylate kinase family enzyme